MKVLKNNNNTILIYFLIVLTILNCTWFDTSQNKIKDQDILLYF